MKKGCFITSVVLFTIVVGVVVYFVKYKKELIKEYSKNKVMSLAIDEFDDNLKKVKSSIYKDSLQSEIHKFFKRNEHQPFETAMKRIEVVMNEAKNYYRDGRVDSLEFILLKNNITYYERSKKN